jgi:hypothetical protein
MMDVNSTYILFRDFPNFAVRNEQNKFIVDSYNRGGLEALPYTFVRFWAQWLGVALTGSCLAFLLVVRHLDMSTREQILISVALGLTLCTIFNFGAGISNFYIYRLLQYGGG